MLVLVIVAADVASPCQRAAGLRVDVLGVSRSARGRFDVEIGQQRDSGDHLHPSDAGYQAMANAVNVGMLVHPSRRR